MIFYLLAVAAIVISILACFFITQAYYKNRISILVNADYFLEALTYDERAMIKGKRLRAVGYQACSSCGRTSGVDYRRLDGPGFYRITLEKTEGGYTCTDCIRIKKVAQGV